MNAQRAKHVELNEFVRAHQDVFDEYAKLLRAFYEAAPQDAGVCVMSGERVLFHADMRGMPL